MRDGSLPPMTRMPCVLDSDVVRRAYFVADVAHTAKGQTRDDGITPYIRHPERCASLALAFITTDNGKFVREPYALEDLAIAVAAAYLHDVVEDTCLTLSDLMRYGITAEIIRIVDLLTKKGESHRPEDAEYYSSIALNPIARLVKAADRCSNLEDVAGGPWAIRWVNYVVRTVNDVIPIYTKAADYRLVAELTSRVGKARAHITVAAISHSRQKIERLEGALVTARVDHVGRIETALMRERDELLRLQGVGAH